MIGVQMGRCPSWTMDNVQKFNYCMLYSIELSVSGELKMTWKEVAVCFKVLYQNIPRGLKKMRYLKLWTKNQILNLSSTEQFW
jgi:hypothetical protein